jgi:glucose-6-phosphate 1-dehydrogenase
LLVLPPQESLLIIVVGASGDLAKKKTYPALYALHRAGLLPADTAIWGFARSPKTDESFRQHLQPTLAGSGKPEEEDGLHQFLEMCCYRHGTAYSDWQCLQSILQDANCRNVLVYLAIPPHVFGATTGAIQQARRTCPVPGFFRVVLEKPFGRDTATCETLLHTLQEQEWPEEDLYRIDHYLGKEMVQNLVTLRQHNSWLRALWNKDAIQSIHILFKEPFGTEGRGGYFDSIGIIRDILQNHLLQVLTLVTMELPSTWTADAIRDAKVKVMEAMSVLRLDDCLLGQYEGYTDDPTITDLDTVCPTYAAIRCRVDTPTWAGVPIVLEAGKALDERLCEIRLHLHGSANSPPNALVVRLQPTLAVYLTTNVKTPGFSEQPVSTHMGVTYDARTNHIPEAYTRLLLAVLRGQQASFVRADELRAAWHIFTPLLHQLEQDRVAPLPYTMRSQGPDLRSDFLRAKGVAQAWLPPASAL